MKVPPRLYKGVRAVMNRLPDRLRNAVAREAWIRYRTGHALRHQLDYLFWETTLRCNLQCIHCGSSCSTEPLAGELTTAEIDDALAGIARRVDPRKVMLVASGGEPTVREDLLEVMGRAARRGHSWGMVTNGLLVDGAKVEELEKAGMRTVAVSIDGTQEHHDLIRLRKGSWKKAVRALEALNASPYLSIVEVITTLNRYNADDLPEVLELIERMGIRYWRIGTVAPIGRAKDDPDLLVTGEQLERAVRFITQHRAGKSKLDISYACEGFLGERFENQARKHRFACWAGIRTASILANGDIAACPDIPRGHFTQGNIRTDDFVDVWDDRFQAYRDRSWMKTGACTTCDSWRVCGGGGMHFWDPDSGRLARCHDRLMTGADAAQA
jgi:radical SAM enzyme (rSAM/lipoprotein system)